METLGPQPPPCNVIFFPKKFPAATCEAQRQDRVSSCIRFSSVTTRELQRLECGAGAFPACILSGRNYNKVVKDLQLFSHSFSQINTWIHFLFSSLRAYCFVPVTTSHSCVPELSSAPQMGMGYQ